MIFTIPSRITIFHFTIGVICSVSPPGYAQSLANKNQQHEKPSTIILFRTFDVFNFGRYYKLYASDSLLGRIKTKDGIVINTYDKGISFSATTKAPSLNANKSSNYQKQKKIRYPITLKSGQVYFVKCGYLNQSLFDLPRQPTISPLKPNEIRKYLKKRFMRRKIKDYLYEEWLNEKDLKQSAANGR